MRNSLMVSLLSVVNTRKETDTNYIIASYIIQNLYQLNDFSTSDLANACHVSKASISRFCKEIGMEDFLDLKAHLRMYNNPIDKKFKVQDITGNYITDYLLDIQQKLEQAKSLINEDTLQQLALGIYNHDKVYVFGQMQSNAIAFTLQHDLIALEKFVYCSQDITVQRDILLNNDDGLVIIFSASGHYFDSILSGRMMNHHFHKKIYLITASSFIEKPSYIDEVIQFDNKDTYSSNIIMHVFANLLAIQYKKVLQCFTK